MEMQQETQVFLFNDDDDASKVKEMLISLWHSMWYRITHLTEFFSWKQILSFIALYIIMVVVYSILSILVVIGEPIIPVAFEIGIIWLIMCVFALFSE